MDVINGFLVALGTYLPSIIGALAILIIGWIIAALVSSLVRRLLNRTGIDEQIGRAISGSGSRTEINSEQWISTAVFWLIMLFVIVAALQTLNLGGIAGPINTLLDTILGYIPNVLGALVYLGLAWLLATVLRLLVTRGLKAIRFDERVGDQISDQPGVRSSSVGASTSPGTSDDETLTRMLLEREQARPSRQPSRAATSGAQQTSLSDTVGNAVYWLVFLFFLPIILDTLNIQGLLEPVQNLLNEILGFLPNLFAAALILLIGWFVAGIVRRIITNVAAAVGVDRLAQRVGLSNVLGSQQLSGLLGLLVYVFILVPVIIAALNALEIEAVTAPASAMLAAFLAAIPNIFAAALILVIAYVVGRVVSGLVVNVLSGLGVNRLLSRFAIGGTNSPSSPAAASTTPADIIGYIVLVGIMLFASIAAFNTLGLDELANLISNFTVLIGQIILGLIIFGIGLFLSDLASRAVEASQVPQSGLLAMAARIAIIVLAGAMALRQMGLANEIITLAFGLILGAIAVAFALAFGLGGREPAQREVERMFQALRSRQIKQDPTRSAAQNATQRLKTPGESQSGD